MRRTRLAKTEACHVPRWVSYVDAARRAGLDLCRVLPGSPVVRRQLAARHKALLERVMAPGGLCQNDALFDEFTIRSTVARCSVGLGLSLDEQDDFRDGLLREHLEPVIADDDLARVKYSTHTNLDDEHVIARIIDAKVDAVFQAPSPIAVDRVIAELETQSDIALDDEQVAMVQAVCSDRGWINCEGFAGTGKTTAFKAVVKAYRDRKSTGHPTADVIVAVSTAANTAQATGRKLGTDEACSIERFCRRVGNKKIRPTERTLIIIDEAVMVDNARMANLLAAAGPARIVCIGDMVQQQPIGAGGWYGDQVGRHGKIELTKVHRQKDQADIDAFFALRNGEAKACLDNLAERDRVHVSDTRAQRVGLAVEHYIAHRTSHIVTPGVKRATYVSLPMGPTLTSTRSIASSNKTVFADVS